MVLVASASAKAIKRIQRSDNHQNTEEYYTTTAVYEDSHSYGLKEGYTYVNIQLFVDYLSILFKSIFNRRLLLITSTTTPSRMSTITTELKKAVRVTAPREATSSIFPMVAVL